LGALADYNQAILLYKGSAKELNRKYAYHNRALLKQLNLKDVSGALADYNKAIELDPRHAQACAGRGLLKMEKIKDKTGAIQDFRQAARIF
jgi:tetratricopeptide (TPR) repeat protein